MGYPKTSAPVEAFSGLAVCEEHKAGVKIKDIVGPAAAAQVNNALASLASAT